ncbi:MAG: hypothetical protein ACPF8V_03625, partial [Luteibaculum sp.]
MFSCESKSFKANITDQDYSLEIYRIDQELFNLEPQLGSALGWMQILEKEHPEFSRVYFEDIMQLGPQADSASAQLLLSFYKDTLWQGLQSDIDENYPDFNEQREKIELGVKRSRYFFPDLEIP